LGDPEHRYRIGTGGSLPRLRYRRRMPGFDLHTHSTFSDGTLDPEQVVELATTRGLTGIALTDHDNTGGVGRARAAAEGTGLTVLLGCELSAEHDGNPVHVLGYGFDPREPVFAAKRAWIAEGRVNRARRIEQLILAEPEHDADSFEAMQFDDYSIPGVETVHRLARLRPHDIFDLISYVIGS